MRKVFVEPVVLPEPRFRDGLGVRYVRTEGTDDPVEVLRPLWDVGAMQNAIRQRVGRLATFRQARFVPVRSAEVPRDDGSTIEVVSDYVPGYRLSQILEAAHAGVVPVGNSTAIYILRELLGALALLHESRGVTHGAVGPERLLITARGRVVVADYVLGPAIERLEFSRPRLWREFRIAVPAGKGQPRLDARADVLQVGVTALALLLGRPIEIAEYPDRMDALVASLSQTQRADRRAPASPPLIAWLRRALLRDPNGKFASVSDARLTLEAVLSSHDAASGGAAALKTLAESFGSYAADLEARAAAERAEEARKAAAAAQEADRAALQEQDDDAAAAAPLSDLVPAFALLPETPPLAPEGVPAVAAPVPVNEADPPVGWRVPEPPPVEDTLPTSPLIQIDTPACEPAAEEFVEEVLDLAGLAGPDDGGAVSAAGPAGEHAVQAAIAQPGTPEGETPFDPAVEVVEVVDLRDLAAAESAPEPLEPLAASFEAAPIQVEDVGAEPAPTEAADIGPVVPAALEAASEVDREAVERAVEPEEPAALVDAALAALAASEAPVAADVPAALPEWRLLADPVGASAPTIDVVEPVESLEELAAAFAAAEPPPVAAEPPPVAAEPPPVAAEPPPVAAEPPAALVDAYVRFFEAPAESTEPAAQSTLEEQGPASERSSVLDDILDLRQSQAAAQAAVEPPPDAPGTGAGAAPDVGAWSFVEELLHHDARFETRPVAAAAPGPDAEGTPAEPASCLMPPRMAAEETEPEPAAPPDEPGVEPRPVAAEAPAFVHDPAVEASLPEFPPDWFVEVRPTPVPPAPLFAGRVEPESAPAPEPEPAPLPAPPSAPRPTPSVLRPEAPMVPRLEPELPEDDENGPVFPRVAPSVRRVRAEARRRRLARLGSSGAALVRTCVDGCWSAVSALGSGVAHAIAAIGRASAFAGRSVLAAAVQLTGAVAHGASGAVRIVAAGVRAIAGAGATAGVGLARGTAALVGAVVSGVGAGVRAAASAAHAAAGLLLKAAGLASKAATAAARAGGGAMLAAARALAAGLGALGRVGRAAAAAGLRGTRQAARGGAGVSAAAARGSAAAVAAAGRAAGRAAANTASAAAVVGSASGRAAAAAAAGIGRAAIRIPRRIYFIASDVADRLPRPAFRPWYLAAALVIIAAVAGVPYAKAWLLTGMPTGIMTPVRDAAGAAAEPEAPVKAAGADVKRTGSIRVTTEPDGAEVLIDGVLHGTAPLTVGNIAEGAHTILVRDGSGSVRETVQVRADEEAEAALQLRPGWLAVFAPVRLEVFEGGRSIGSTERGRILTPPGPHTIEVVSEAIGFRDTRQVEIKPGRVAAVTIAMPPATLEIEAPADAEILVDGEPVGTAPLGPIQVAVGTREIVMRHPTLGERRQIVSVTYLSPARVVFE